MGEENFETIQSASIFRIIKTFGTIYEHPVKIVCLGLIPRIKGK